MKEILQEVKERILALYWGCEALRFNAIPQHIYKVGNEISVTDHSINGMHLELKSLSDITDEDAMGVSKYYTGNIPGGLDKTEREILIKSGRETALSINDKMHKGYSNRCALLYAFDFLRSRRYTLPAFGFTVDQLIEAGIFKLKTQ